ncbi:Uncharacterised protein [Streptococcus macacae NCTC 11558]|nr:Uncharacterised protein [Streptococcus macacae NCTC 11558]
MLAVDNSKIPLYDVAQVFRVSFSAVLKTPKTVLKWGSKLVTSVNKVAAVNLKKYAWQFGQADFTSSVSEVLKQAQTVDYHKISIPSLFLVGAGDSPELLRQTEVIAENFRKRGVPITVRKFESASGSDAHCQVNHFRLMNYVVFEWLNHVFKKEYKAD